jgi:proteasome accessory factor B
VHFTASAAFYARERVWGQEQTVEEEADGSIILSFTAAGLTEIKRWALSFGSAARVIEPENLAATIAAEAEALAATYRNNG